MHKYRATSKGYYPKRTNSTVKANNLQRQIKNDITCNQDEKQRRYLNSILQDRHVLFVKLIRIIHQQGLDIF